MMNRKLVFFGAFALIPIAVGVWLFLPIIGAVLLACSGMLFCDLLLK